MILKKIKNISRLVVLLLVIIVIFKPLQVLANSQKNVALKAYSEMLSKSTIKWDVYKGTKYMPLRDTDEFGVVYVDKDNVPELVVHSHYASHCDGYYCLYTYKNGKIIVYNMLDEFKYYHKKGIVIAITRGMGEELNNYRIFSGKKVKEYLEKNGTYGYGNEYSNVSYHTYLYKNKKVTKVKFQKLLKKRVGNKKPSKPVYYKNTAANRQNVLGY